MIRLISLVVLLALPAPLLAAPKWLSTEKCDQVDLSAEAALCDRSECVLLGAVTLICGDLRARSDQATVLIDENQAFAGATLQGHVLVTQGRTVLRCEKVELGPDRVQGRVDGAEVAIKVEKSKKPLQERRNEAFFTGTLQRKSTSEFSVEDGDFTLCDCGDNPPSWKVGASRIDVNLNEDAIAWWPQFYISPFGLLDPLPITPPLLPIRIPLKNRATGFLAPGIQFLSDSRWPTIDLPFFIPLGRSYDLTLTPGMRLDWRDTTESGIGAYGSPQLESRLRYAPARSHNGELSAAWTHDSVHGFAKNLEITSPSTDAEQALWDLQDRVHLKWEHDSRFGDTKRWLMDAEWMSDDRYLRDFRVSVDERVAAYLPSRTTFLVRDPVFSSLSQVDYLLALQNPDNALSNLGGAESETPHRLGTAVYLHPQSLGAGLFTHGQASLWQFGPLAGGKSAEIVSSDARAGLSFADSLGPLRLRAESTVGGSYIHRPGQADDSRWTFGHSDAQASLRLARRYSELWHILEPQLRISSLIWKSEAVADNSWNESLQTDDYSQLAVGVSQSLVMDSDGAELLHLLVEQPLSLQDNTLHQTRARLRIKAGRTASAQAWLSLDPSDSFSLAELGLAGWLKVGFFKTGLSYVQVAQQTERFYQSIYELAGTLPGQDEPDRFLHTLNGSLSMDLYKVLQTTYSAAYLLPTPEEKDRREFITHRFMLKYQSPCHCWGTGIDMTFRPEELDKEDRYRIRWFFSIGEMRVGR